MKKQARRKSRKLTREEEQEAVEAALYAAALNGNTDAMQIWLHNRDPKKWPRPFIPAAVPDLDHTGNS